MTAPYWPDKLRLLASYAYPDALNNAVAIPGVDLMVDSGAFTADSIGKKIDMDEYCEWLIRHQSNITTAVVLDVIGDWRGTARNHEIMMGKLPESITVLPVWHATSPLSELDRLCRAHDYVGIGGVTTMARTVKQFMQHSIRAHKVAELHGTKLHGLGVTGRTAMTRLPWSTVDSSTWLSGARYGNLILYGWDYRQVTARAGERPTPEATKTLRAYGGNPTRLSQKGFGTKAGGGDYQHEYRWMCEAACRSMMIMEGYLRARHGRNARIYQACGTNVAVNIARRAYALGNPFN